MLRRFETGFPGKGGTVKRGNQRDATRRTVLVAAAANILVGLAKLAAGIISGSSAMLAEAAHSAADTLDQLFLLTSLRQADRPANRTHPFGHGQERYFWSLLAAFGIFVAGGGFSIFEGILSMSSTHSESPLVAYAALGVAFIAEGTSFVRAFVQVRGEARHNHEEILDHVESSPDITVKVALFEDSAAVVGLVFAAAGVTLREVTGSSVWDGGASIAIGVLLLVVAVKLGMDSKELLIGRAATPELERLIREEIKALPGVEALLELRTMHIGPDNLIVAARVDLDNDLLGGQTEDLADEVDRRLSEKLPLAPHVFIDPTPARARLDQGQAEPLAEAEVPEEDVEREAADRRRLETGQETDGRDEPVEPALVPGGPGQLHVLPELRWQVPRGDEPVEAAEQAADRGGQEAKIRQVQQVLADRFVDRDLLQAFLPVRLERLPVGGPVLRPHLQRGAEHRGFGVQPLLAAGLDRAEELPDRVLEAEIQAGGDPELEIAVEGAVGHRAGRARAHPGVGPVDRLPVGGLVPGRSEQGDGDVGERRPGPLERVAEHLPALHGALDDPVADAGPGQLHDHVRDAAQKRGAQYGVLAHRHSSR